VQLKLSTELLLMQKKEQGLFTWSEDHLLCL